MKYFKIKELTDSTTAKAKGINNYPNKDVMNNLKSLIDVLDIIREDFGKPIRVNSGYRSPELNKAIGGAKNSHHVTGCAADLDTGNKEENKRLFNCIKQLNYSGAIEFTQLIDERNFSWVHFSFDSNNLKNQILAL